MSAIESFFTGTFGNPYVATFCIAAVPVVELRGAIPFGSSPTIWGGSQLSIWQAYGISLLSATLVVVILLALLIPTFNFLKRAPAFARVINYFEVKFKSQANSMKSAYAVFVFAALPLPLTGVWTASALAVFMGMPYAKSLFTIVLGTAVSGLIIVGATLLLGENAVYLFYATLVLALVVMVILAQRVFHKRRHV